MFFDNVSCEPPNVDFSGLRCGRPFPLDVLFSWTAAPGFASGPAPWSVFSSRTGPRPRPPFGPRATRGGFRPGFRFYFFSWLGDAIVIPGVDNIFFFYSIIFSFFIASFVSSVVASFSTSLAASVIIIPMFSGVAVALRFGLFLFLVFLLPISRSAS